jgi:lipopolysaccharide export system protein LptA
VLSAGILLVIALVVFLAVGRWKRRINATEVLKALGANIQQEANGWTYSHALGAHAQYKIHASKEVQFKEGNARLHDVKIELYGEDGSRVDRIEGSEFDYDQKQGSITAIGPVEITLMRPGVAPAIAPKATPSKAMADKPKGTPLAGVVKTVSSDEIHVKTSGLSFDQKSGVATTKEHVDFSMAQGTGSSMGATYDSQHGHLVLDHAVELNTQRKGGMIVLHAQHGEFERETDLCNFLVATAEYRGGEATAAVAKIFFRADGSAQHLDATGGFTMTTANGGHVLAPTGSMDFDEHNQPSHGHLEGGVVMDSVRENETKNGSQNRHVHGTSPTANLDFTPQGELRHVHLERGVEMHSEEVNTPVNSGAAADSKAGPLRVSRTWRSPIADVDFREAAHGQMEPARIHGTEGVVVTGESQRGKQPIVPSRIVADDMTGDFGPASQLKSMTGVGHASMQETTATGTLQTSSGDRVETHFLPPAAPGAVPNPQATTASSSAAQIESAVLDGHVVLLQQPAAKPAARSDAPAPSTMRATAGHAVYEGAGGWLHLTINPRVEDGGLQLTAEKIDVSHDTGDAFAHTNVKATWTDTGAGDTTPSEHQVMPAMRPASQSSLAFGGREPSHVISSEAELQQATGVATFKGHARLWQQGNSVTAPMIVLDRQRQTLVARSTDPAEPVRAVLVSAAGSDQGRAGSDVGKSTANQPRNQARNNSSNAAEGKSSTPSVIRVRGGDLKYSDAEHKAVMRAGALGHVVAETGTATSISDDAELILLPPGNHAGKTGGQGQVDRMTARGHVVVTSQSRRGTGEQLVYTSETGEYVLTGTAAAPPRMNDPVRGTVTGEALIFHSFDDSVSAEGGKGKTTTDTTAPK